MSRSDDKHVSFGRETLRGLEVVTVMVEKPALDQVAHKGLGQADLQAMVEDRLYRNGVGVVSLEGLATVQRQPVLYLRPSVVQVLPKGFCYGLNLFLMQQVTMLDGQRTEALTWEHGIIGTVVDDDWSTFRASLEKTLDTFINDFISVNHNEKMPDGQEMH